MKDLCRILTALLGLCSAALASTTVSFSIPTGSTSYSVSQSQHGFVSYRLGLHVHDGSENLLPTTAYSYTIDHSTYLVSITFSTATSAGTSLYLTGSYDGADTTGADDFKVMVEGATRLALCYQCDSFPAQRTYNGRVYGMEETPVLTMIGGTTYEEVRIYIADNQIIFGISSSANAASLSGNHAAIAYGVWAYPVGSIPLGMTTYSSGGCFCDNVSDDRPSAFQ